MSFLSLSSYERLRRYCAARGGDIISDDADNKRDFLTWIPSVSQKIEKYLNRELFIESRTEYQDITYNKDEYWIKAPPISSTDLSVYVDSSGEFDGGESELSNYYIGSQEVSIVLAYAEPYTVRRGIRFIYTGGLAYHGTRSVFAVTPSATWTVGNYCIGNTSLAVGIVRAASGTAMTIEILYGLFEVDETLTEYTGEDASGATTKTATLDSKTQECLAEAYPDIVRGCEAEIRYYWEHKMNFENTGSQKDGTTVRRDSSNRKRYPLQPEVIDMIDPFRIPTL